MQSACPRALAFLGSGPAACAGSPFRKHVGRSAARRARAIRRSRIRDCERRMGPGSPARGRERALGPPPNGFVRRMGAEVRARSGLGRLRRSPLWLIVGHPVELELLAGERLRSGMRRVMLGGNAGAGRRDKYSETGRNDALLLRAGLFGTREGCGVAPVVGKGGLGKVANAESTPLNPPLVRGDGKRGPPVVRGDGKRGPALARADGEHDSPLARGDLKRDLPLLRGKFESEPFFEGEAS